MTKWRGALPFGFVEGEGEQQVPPLRYAAVGMTIHFEYWEFGILRERRYAWGLLVSERVVSLCHTFAAG